MIYLIPLFIIIVSVFGIAYIVIRRVQSLSGLSSKELIYPQPHREEKFGSGVKKEGDIAQYNIVEKFLKETGGGDTFFVFMEKFFRKMRVRLMRFENLLTSLAERLREKRLKKELNQKHDERESKAFKDDVNVKSSNDDVGSKNSKASLSVIGGGESSEFDENYWLSVLKHDPQSVYPYKKLGEIYICREDFRQARAMLSYALKLDPRDNEAIEKIKELKGKKTKKK